MYNGQCHCGAIKFTITATPAQLVDCNCSLCRRLGALWAHVPIESVSIDALSDAATSYAQGDRTLAVRTCKHCGCTTHYDSLKESSEIMAVNFRMRAPEVLSEFRIKA